MRETAGLARGEWFVAHERPHPLHDIRNGQQALDARQVDPAIVYQPFDDLQPIEFAARNATLKPVFAGTVAFPLVAAWVFRLGLRSYTSGNRVGQGA